MCTHVHFRVTTQSDKMTCGRGFANSFLGAIPDYFGSRATTITLMELSKSGSHNLFYNSLCQFVILLALVTDSSIASDAAKASMA